MVQAEVDSRDDAYRWLMHWLSKHPTFSRATSVSVTTNLSGTFGTSVPAITSAAAAAGGAGGPPVTFLPAPGDHLLSYKGRWMVISRQRTSGNPQLAANARYRRTPIRSLQSNRHALSLKEPLTCWHWTSLNYAAYSVAVCGWWLGCCAVCLSLYSLSLPRLSGC
jgi:chaperone BCS1